MRKVVNGNKLLIAARERVETLEKALQEIVRQYLDQTKLGVCEQARMMDLTPSYISDIRLGKRKISAAFVEKLALLEKNKKG